MPADTPPRPEIDARLDHVLLHSPDPARCAAFYARVYRMACRPVGDAWVCSGPGRRLVFAYGAAQSIGAVAYAFDSHDALAIHRQAVAARGGRPSAPPPQSSFAAVDAAFSVTDPDGNRVVFGVRSADAQADAAGAAADAESGADAEADPVPPARLQHLALRSAEPARLRAYYRDVLGFVVSDSVYEPGGELRACFLRSDREHHALAVFHAAQPRHDHLSFETADWHGVRDWADRMVALDVPIAWGIGRHGPGNDTFFMVRDPDGNLAEISSDLEVCAPARPEGRWPHAERTLNLWGSAIMRS